MSILGQKIREIPFKLTILKRGGVDHYSGGQKMAETEKAILVAFQEGYQTWLQKKFIYDNEDHYNYVAKMWVPYLRVKMERIEND